MKRYSLLLLPVLSFKLRKYSIEKLEGRALSISSILPDLDVPYYQL